MIIWKDSSYYQPNILVNKQNKINKNENKYVNKTKATVEIIGEYGL